MRKISIIGHYGFGSVCLNGQTIKTKMLTQELQSAVGKDEVVCFDTHGRWLFVLRAPFQIFSAVKRSRNVLILPAYKGVLVITPLLVLFNFLFHRSLHYVVIGGWLPSYVRRFPLLRRCLRKFAGIYVETQSMKEQIEEVGLKNIVLMPNFKRLEIVTEEETEIAAVSQEPLRLCTFSRVMKEKGIEDAVEAVRRVNALLQREAFTLDIYGQVWASQKDWFDTLTASFPSYVRYAGCVEYDNSVSVLRDYFALLFPTYYEGEGVAGTFIDAFAAGLPCLVSDWHDNARIVHDGVTGLVFPPKDVDALVSMLLDASKNPKKINAMRPACVREALTYLPQNVLPVLTSRLQ